MNRIYAATVACLTVGLAPFFPEPHIVGKLRWIIGGADGMTSMDWADTAFHGAPWIALATFVVHESVRRIAAR